MNLTLVKEKVDEISKNMEKFSQKRQVLVEQISEFIVEVLNDQSAGERIDRITYSLSCLTFFAVLPLMSWLPQENLPADVSIEIIKNFASNIETMAIMSLGPVSDILQFNDDTKH